MRSAPVCDIPARPKRNSCPPKRRSCQGGGATRYLGNATRLEPRPASVDRAKKCTNCWRRLGTRRSHGHSRRSQATHGSQSSAESASRAVLALPIRAESILQHRARDLQESLLEARSGTGRLRRASAVRPDSAKRIGSGRVWAAAHRIRRPTSRRHVNVGMVTELDMY